MFLRPASPPVVGSAEQLFREAFNRLKRDKPELMAKGTPVTQNNVAREAGRDTSALKKDRYPELIREIQHWVEEHAQKAPKSPRQAILATRNRNRSLKAQIIDLKRERDIALSMLVEADATILDLTAEVGRLQRLQPSSGVKVTRNK